MISNLFKEDITKILTYFLISPGSRHTRKEIKEKTNMNNIPLDKALKSLLTLKILKIEKSMYTLNQANEKSREILLIMKKEYDYFGLPHDIFNLLVKISSSISDLKEIREIVLFGSYSKLIYTDKSDIDIAIILEDKIKNKVKIEEIIEKRINKIEEKSKKLIEPHFFVNQELKEKDPIIKDIIKNGKSLI